MTLHQRFIVDGMTCEGCVKTLSNVLSKDVNISELNISLEHASVDLRLKPDTTTVEKIKSLIEDAGFSVKQVFD